MKRTTHDAAEVAACMHGSGLLKSQMGVRNVQRHAPSVTRDVNIAASAAPWTVNSMRRNGMRVSARIRLDGCPVSFRLNGLGADSHRRPSIQVSRSNFACSWSSHPSICSSIEAYTHIYRSNIRRLYTSTCASLGRAVSQTQ